MPIPRVITNAVTVCEFCGDLPHELGADGVGVRQRVVMRLRISEGMGPYKEFDEDWGMFVQGAQFEGDWFLHALAG